MSFLKYNNPTAATQKLSDGHHFSMSADIGNGTIKCSGQCGFDPETGEVPDDAQKQVDLTFKNIDLLLKAEGLRGWEDVYFVRSYHTNIDETLPLYEVALKQHTPNHRPMGTAVGVSRLAFPAFKIEIEIEAKKQP